jgi:hypothetical protein
MLGQILPLLQRVVADLDAPLATLIGIANAIPYPSLALAEADLAITRRILAELPYDAPGKRATWLVTLAIHLGQVGHLAEALPQPRRRQLVPGVDGRPPRPLPRRPRSFAVQPRRGPLRSGSLRRGAERGTRSLSTLSDRLRQQGHPAEAEKAWLASAKLREGID